MTAKDFFNSLEEFGGWAVSNTEKMFKKKDLEKISKVKVVERTSKETGDDFLCMVFFMKSGTQKSHYLSSMSDLDDGDIVDPKSVELLTLSKEGEDDIYRLDGKKLASSEVEEDDEDEE